VSQECSLIVLLLAVLVPALPRPNAGRGDTGKSFADRCEGFLLALGDDEHATAQDGLVWQALGEVEPVAVFAWRPMLGTLFVARPHVWLVQPDTHEIVVARIGEYDACTPHIPAEQLLCLLSRYRPEAFALHNLGGDAGALYEVLSMLRRQYRFLCRSFSSHRPSRLLSEMMQCEDREPHQNGAPSSSKVEPVALPS